MTRQTRPVLGGSGAGTAMGWRRTNDFGRRSARVFCLAALLGAVAACGVPVTVTRLSQQDAKSRPVAGLRYTVKRPSYTTYLRVLDAPEPGSEPTLASCSPSGGGKVPSGALDQGRPACIAAGNCTFELSIEQKMDADPLVFEATSRVNPLADSEIEFTLKEDGALSAVMAGETDRSLEVVKAAIGLAKTAAAAAAPAAPAIPSFGRDVADCKELYDKLVAHVRRHESGLRALACLQARALDLEASLLKSGATKERLDTLAALRTSIAEKQKSIDEDRVGVPAGHVSLAVDGTIVKQSSRECHIDVALDSVGR